MNVTRCNHAACDVGNLTIYVFCGEKNNKKKGGNLTNEIERLELNSTSTGKW